MEKPPVKYTSTAIALHWAIALLIFMVFPLGLYMHDLPVSPDKLRLFSYHKWAGITILLLITVRIAWRITHAPPELPGTIHRWERNAATAIHALLYVLVLAVPLSGWLMSSAQGFQTVWFAVLPLPDLVGRNKELAVLLKELHKTLNFLLIALIAAHVLAAFKHRFVHRDGILERMLP